MEAHLVDLQSQLVGTRSPAARARVHLELGRHALREERPLQARRHLEEALLLDSELTAAQRLLSSLDPVEPPARGLLKRLLRR